MSQPYTIQWELEYDEELFNPSRFDALMDELFQILSEEVNQAVVISKYYLVPVRTGYLQSTIGIIDENPAGLSILAGTQGCPYAVYVEFGTSRMAARPFWRPPIWEAFFRIAERADEAVRRWASV